MQAAFPNFHAGKMLQLTLEEIVADSMFKVFENEKYLAELYETHETLVEKIKSKLKNFAQELKNAAKRLKNAEAQAMAQQEAEHLDELVEKFNQAATVAYAYSYMARDAAKEAKAAEAKETQAQETKAEEVQEGTEETSYSLKDSDGDEITITAAELEENKKTVANMDTVAEVTGNRFAKNETKDFVTAGTEYFESIGGKAENATLGTVKLTEAGIRHLISRGLTRRRAALLEAVKPVIEQGQIIQIDNNHKGKSFDGALIAARVTLDNVPYYMGVAIKQQDTQDNAYYMSDAVVEQEKKDTDDVVKQDRDAMKNGATPATSQDPSIASILATIAKYKGENEENARYSLKEDGTLASLQDVDAINMTMRQEIEDNKEFRDMLRKLNRVAQTRGEITAAQQKDVRRIAANLIKQWNVDAMTQKTLAANLTTAFNAMANAKTTAEAEIAMEAMADIAQDVIENSLTGVNRERYDKTKAFRDWARSGKTEKIHSPILFFPASCGKLWKVAI